MSISNSEFAVEYTGPEKPLKWSSFLTTDDLILRIKDQGETVVCWVMWDYGNLPAEITFHGVSEFVSELTSEAESVDDVRLKKRDRSYWLRVFGTREIMI